MVGAECFSAKCAPDNRCTQGGAGKRCLDGGDCLSGDCAGPLVLACEQGDGNERCDVDTDCKSGKCRSDKSCEPEGTVPPGQACEGPGECYSASCTDGFCDPGGVDDSCNDTQLCGEDLACENGFCVVVVGAP
jgi:hypothetical protein